MEEQYLKRVKYNLMNVSSELKNILALLDDAILINNEAIQSKEIREIQNKVDVQIDNLVYYIIPAVRKM